eukprot:scaffold53716_cov67-Phaeocystis_antarctica.AAC.2
MGRYRARTLQSALGARAHARGAARRARLARHGRVLPRNALLCQCVDFGSCLFLSRASSVSSGVSLLTHLTHRPLQQRAPVQLEPLDDRVPGDRTRSTRVTRARQPSRAGKGRGRHIAGRHGS